MLDGFVKTVKEKANIYDIINAVVPLKKFGAQYKGLCPFHGEKTPSFTVDPHHQSYHCFGCGEHGDVISFIQKQKKLTFMESLAFLSNQLGLEMPQATPLTPQQKEQQLKQKEKKLTLLEVHEKLTVYYETCLLHSLECQQYLQKRKISIEAQKVFRLGWANDDVSAFARWLITENISIASLKEIGVLAESDQPQYGEEKLGGLRLRFKNRLMCPIFDQLDQVIAYSGRVITAEAKFAKYVNSPETPLFTKGKNLYGLKTAKESLKKSGSPAKILICEGNLDVISLWQEGFDYAVAPMGTALTLDQCEMIARLQPKEVICMMDGDKAGINASFKALPLLLQVNFQPRAIFLSDGHDPDSFLKQPAGAMQLQALMDQAEPLLLLCAKYLFERSNKDIVAQYEIIRKLKPFFDMIKEDVIKILYIEELIPLLNCSEHVIYRVLHVKRPFIARDKKFEGGKKDRHDFQKWIDMILGSKHEFKSFSQKLAALDPRLKLDNISSSLYPLLLEASNIELEDSLQNQIKKSILGAEIKNENDGQPKDKPKSITEILNYLKPPKAQTERTIPSALLDRIRMLIQKPEYLKKFIELDGISQLNGNLIKEFLLELYHFHEDNGFLNADAFFSRHETTQNAQEKELLQGLKACLFTPYEADLEKYNVSEILEKLVYTFKAEKIHKQMQQISLQIKQLDQNTSREETDFQEKIEISIQNPLNDLINTNTALSKEELFREYQLLQQEYREAINRSTHFNPKQR